MGKMWNENVFLTFDMDWAIDEVMEDFYALLKKYGLVGTIHVTHETSMLEQFRIDGILDLGIHPNYNLALQSGGGGYVRSGFARNKTNCSGGSMFKKSCIDEQQYYRDYFVMH